MTPLTADDIACRIRWQLDGWLTGGRGESRAAAGFSIVMLRLEPVEVIGSGNALRPVRGMVCPESEVDSERARTALPRCRGCSVATLSKIPCSAVVGARRNR